MNGNTVENLNKNQCTGCGACYNICPTQAIVMKKNNEGFCEPYIDFNKCVDCGRCAKVCPQMGDKVKYESVKHTFGIRCKDSIREKCSSGGVFGAIAEWAISKHGTVFGASFTDDFKKVVHIKVKSTEQLKPLFKSKYLQSDTGLIFRDVKNELETSNAPVVFSGCPCQIAGLKSYLNKDYSNLITIDILCHGVVSPGAYQIFLQEFFGDVDSPIKNVDFRSKELGWACKVMIVAEDGTKRISQTNGDYFNAFLWGYSQRNVCFDCKYARQERVGDITIGDFWGIDKVLPQLNDGKGVSLVLCNTEKGYDVIKNIQRYIDKSEECDYATMLNAVKDINWALYKPGIKPANREVFFYRLSRGDTFSQAFRYASSAKYDVGIFGWWFEDQWTNYGSTLTYYALMEYVSSLGLSVCMITSPFHKRENASDFIKKHGYVMTPTYSFDSFKKHNENIDTFLIGSDQLWFYHCYKSWGHSLFLDFANDDKKKIAYATSFGHSDPNIPDGEIPILKKLLSRFDAISNREFDGVKIMSEKFGLDTTQTIDPVFLCDMKNWQSIADDAERKTKGDFIFAYILDPDDDKIKALEYVSKKIGLKVVSITDKQYDNDVKVKKLNKFGILEQATIPEQIYHLMNAKYVITDSYHGTCFSILFKRNFVSIINAQRGVPRFETIAKIFNIENRCVYNANDILHKQELLEQPDYSKIEPLVRNAVQKSKAWLNYQLFSNKNGKALVNIEHERTHASILRDLNFLHQMGYSIGRWLKDNKINHISVYCDDQCLDIFEQFLISLQMDESIIVDGYYSNHAFEFKHFQTINLGYADFRNELPLNGTVIYVCDKIKSFDLPGCKVINFLSQLWEAMLYANVYRPIMQFKKLHPNVNLVAVNFPIMPPENQRNERESIMVAHKKDYDYGNIKYKLPETFSVFKDKNYSHAEWAELFRFAASETDINGNRVYSDYRSKYRNIENGHRITLKQPQNPKKTVFMLGGCVTFGYGCCDADTSSSKLQEQLNKKNIDYKVENYGQFLTHRKKDLYNALFNLPVKDGDIIVFEIWNKIPDICKEYFDFLDLSTLFYRPHNYGNVIIDYMHPSHIGQKVIADKIFEFLNTKSFYEHAEHVAPNIDVEPMEVWGIPKQYLNGKKDSFNHPELTKYLDMLKKYKDEIGAIVMNCNPFTLGHRYLIETAAKQCKKLFVFVVEEDKSIFKFADRLELVKQGTADLDNVIVLPSGKFMILSLTFKDYFNKSELQEKQIDPTMDVEIFAKEIAPSLNITIRFAGEEPLDKVTKQYNDTMRQILPQYGIRFEEIKRKEDGGEVISASRVRKLLNEKNFDAIAKIVPNTTLDFLKANYKLS